MLRLTLLRFAFKHAVQDHIDGLALDVILRRMQSSSLVNKARSLEAHFALQPAKLADGDTTPGSACSNASVPVTRRASQQQDEDVPALRDILSNRLLADVERSSLGGQSTVDDLSLVAANAIRHRLSPQLKTRALQHLAEVVHNQRGAARRTVFPRHSPDGTLREVEALTRVMEACVDVEDAFPGSGAHCLDLDEWAAVTSAVEERWESFLSSESSVLLLLQFFSLRLHRPQPCSSSPDSSAPEDVNAAAADGGSARRSLRLALTQLQIDPALVQARCYLLCEKATQWLTEAPPPSATRGYRPLSARPAELVRLVHTTQRLRQYELHVESDDAKPPTTATTANAGGASSRPRKMPLLWGSGGTGNGGNNSSSTGTASVTTTSTRHRVVPTPLSTCVSAYVVAHTLERAPGAVVAGRGAELGASSPSQFDRWTLPQLASVFAVVCEMASAETVARVAMQLGSHLRGLDIVVEVEKLVAVVQIAEQCMRRTDGTQSVLAAALTCFQRSPLFFAAAPLGAGAIPGSPQLTVELTSLWARACHVLDGAPLTLSTSVDAVLLGFVKALSQNAEVFSRLGTAAAAATASGRAPDPAVTPELQAFCSARYAVLLLCSQVLQRPRLYLNQRVEEQVHRLIRLLPFSREAAPSRLSSSIHAFSVLMKITTRGAGSSPQQVERLKSIAFVLEELGPLLAQHTKRSDDCDVTAFPPLRISAAERVLLRDAVRALRHLQAGWSSEEAERGESTPRVRQPPSPTASASPKTGSLLTALRTSVDGDELSSTQPGVSPEKTKGNTDYVGGGTQNQQGPVSTSDEEVPREVQVLSGVLRRRLASM